MAAAAVALLVALVAWAATAARMDGMDAGPGTDLGGLGWFVGLWVTMMAAMMLPSAAPAMALFARTAGGGLAWLFAAGYLATWTALGVVAFAAERLVAAVEGGALAWDSAGPWVAGGAVAAAGIYELTPLKHACLSRCRSPLSFLLGRWRAGRLGALRMGAAHGAWCVGCCVGLMGVLFAVGVMSVTWMAIVAAVVLGEKLLPGGERLAKGVGVGLVVLGVWIAAAPGSVPGLTQPGAPTDMRGGAMPAH